MDYMSYVKKATPVAVLAGSVSAGSSYFDFSDLATTITNATEAIDALVTAAPSILKLVIVFVILGAIALAITMGIQVLLDLVANAASGGRKKIKF